MNDQVLIFDTTLRDGEQSLPASLNVKEKLQIAYALERLGVDFIEAGFPISSPNDYESVKTIATNIKNSRICALARAIPRDIEMAAKALKVADTFRIHTFISTSNVHVQDKLRKNYDDVIEMGINAIKYALKFTDDVEFSCEDAGRTPADNLCRIVESAIIAGAKTINIPDTVGYTLPNEFGNIIKMLFNRVPNIDKATISIHCHDDLGLSVANSMAAIQAGARQIEGTINGIGERAGNCALEEIAMILKTRKQFLNLKTNIDHQKIYHTSKLVSQLCNMPIQNNKAIVGNNAFSHSSGIHQDGMIKNKNTYEIMTPESIGLKNQELRLTSRSGRAAIKIHLDNLGYKKGDYDLDKLYTNFLKLADRKGQVYDYDLEALMHFSNLKEKDDYYKINYLSVQTTGELSTVSIKLQCGEEERSEAATGNGPIDALYQCIYRITQYDVILDKYELHATGQGENSLGQAHIIAKYKQRFYHGKGVSTDIIESSAEALIHVINSIYKINQVEQIKEKKTEKAFLEYLRI